MHRDLLSSWSIAFWKVLELIFQNLSSVTWSEHLLIPNWHLPFGILITRLLKQLKFNLSTKRSIEPSVDINNTLLKRMRARERVPAPQPLLSFLLLYMDPPQPLLLLLIHIQSFLLSFGSMTWRCLQIFRGWSKELTMTCNISALLFAICRPMSTRRTVGTLGLFHFREATRSPFLHQVLHLIHGYLLPSFRGLAPPENPDFQKDWPLLLMTKKGREIPWSYLGSYLGCSVFIWVLYLCTFYFWTYSIWWTYVCYIVVFNGHVFCGM